MHKSTAKGVAFDLDETLTKSKVRVTSEIADLLTQLSLRMPVAIVSGASFERMMEQIVSHLDKTAYRQLSLFPTGGAAAHVFDGSNWNALYKKSIDEEKARKVISILETVIGASGLINGLQSWGERIEFRGSQITFSALGQNAPYEEKVKWDPDKTKRLYLRELLMPKLPDYDIALGGATSLDVIEKGVNKGYAVTQFAEQIGVPVENILYVGDDLKEGGNDYVVAASTKAQTHAVTNPEETMELIKMILQDENS